MAVVKFYIDDQNQEYSVSGTAINSENKPINVGFYSGNYNSASNEFNYYSEENGFDCQRVIIRKV